MDLMQQFAEYESQAITTLNAANDATALEAARIEFLGAKNGRLRDLQGLLGKATKDEKPLVGKRFNEVKEKVTAAWEARQRVLNRPKSAASGLDITLPGTRPRVGRRHPLSQTIAEFKDIMGRFGFTVVEGPEIEDEFHNFDALNIPADHPARDPLDMFYLATMNQLHSAAGSQLAADLQPAAGSQSGGAMLLRSQTSTVQIRVMEQTPPPVRIISVGRVYRPDVIDATHHCMFHQMEGLMIGDDVTMAQLKTVLSLFAEAYLGHDVTIRFRPSFFPFTEPSVEVDMSWPEMKGGWVEIGGAGMVDPNVLRAVGYDPEKVSGFAFGLGVERFCMRRHKIPDIRYFTNNDVKFLKQFP